MTIMKPLGRVMLVDDEQFDLKMYQRTLERAQAAQELLSFTYAEAALDHLCNPENPPVDLILLDVNMPRMNGFEFLQALEEKANGFVNAVIILMLSTTLTQTDRLRAENSALIKTSFKKPFKEADVEEAAHLVEMQRAAFALNASKALSPLPFHPVSKSAS